MLPLIVCAIVFVILVVAEIGGRNGLLKSEFGRKFVHISVGSFVAFWPFFLSWQQIIALSIAFLVVIAASKYLRIFRAIHSVQRPTWGEVFFAISVGLLATLTNEEWIYTIALLHMSLADGFAAVVGTKFGKNNSYKVVGHTKSVAGTGAFMVVSLLLFVLYGVATGAPLAPAIIASGVLVAAAFENISIYGFDNLVVPVWVAFILAMV